LKYDFIAPNMVPSRILFIIFICCIFNYLTIKSSTKHTVKFEKVTDAAKQIKAFYGTAIDKFQELTIANDKKEWK
jgi:hypothetical protein